MLKARTILGVLFALLVQAAVLYAGSPLDISGKWSFIPAKSKAAAGTSFSGSDVTLDIAQTQTSVQISQTIKTPGGMVDTTADDFALDGKERSTTEGPVVIKRLGSWSADKKNLILTKTVSMGSRVFTTENLYAVSEDGKVLTIQSKETMNAKEGRLVLVYGKQ